MSSPPGSGVRPGGVAATDRLGPGIDHHLRGYGELLWTNPGAPLARMIGDAGGRVLDVAGGNGIACFSRLPTAIGGLPAGTP